MRQQYKCEREREREKVTVKLASRKGKINKIIINKINNNKPFCFALTSF